MVNGRWLMGGEDGPMAGDRNGVDAARREVSPPNDPSHAAWGHAAYNDRRAETAGRRGGPPRPTNDRGHAAWGCAVGRTAVRLASLGLRPTTTAAPRKWRFCETKPIC